MHEFSKLSDHVNAIIDQNNYINYIIIIIYREVGDMTKILYHNMSNFISW